MIAFAQSFSDSERRRLPFSHFGHIEANCGFTVLFFFAISLSAQIWTDTDIYDIRGERKLAPKTARGLRADTEALRIQLWSVPLETSIAAEASQAIISLPSPDGKSATFRIVLPRIRPRWSGAVLVYRSYYYRRS